MYKTKAREALEINRLKTLSETDKTFKVVNRDNGDLSHHEPLFGKTGNH